MSRSPVTRVYSWRAEKEWPHPGSLALVKRPIRTIEGTLVEVWQPILIVHKQTDFNVKSGKYWMRILGVPVTLRKGRLWCGCAPASWFHLKELTPYVDVFPEKRKEDKHMAYLRRWMRKHGQQDMYGKWKYVPKGRKGGLAWTDRDHLDGESWEKIVEHV